MLVLDLRFLFLIPVVLAEAFLLWTLWNLIQQGRTEKGRAPARLVSVSQDPASGAARVFTFPESSSAAPGARSSGLDAGPPPQQSGQSSPPRQRLAGSPTL
jgi:hypothetical protein